MKPLIKRKLMHLLTLPLAILVAIAGSVGLAHPEIYGGATPNWLTQTVGQDGVNLFLIVPVLLISVLYANLGSRLALQLWAGANIYLVYTFLIYCFDVQFNSLFIVYCFILGLSSYSVGIFLYRTIRDDSPTGIDGNVVNKIVGYFMIVLSAAFYALWLSDILPAALSGETPQGLKATGLLTNPVHVIDLAIFLPFVFIIGVLVLRQNPFAINLAAPVMFFIVLMDITIAVLAWLLFRRGLDPGYSVVLIMGIHAVLTLIVVAMLIRKTVYIKPIYL